MSPPWGQPLDIFIIFVLSCISTVVDLDFIIDIIHLLTLDEEHLGL